MTERIDHLKEEPFLDGPGDALSASVAAALRTVSPFALIFGTAIEDYPRQDFTLRDLPAIRIYNDNYAKTAESWFIDGELTLDIVLPMSCRRGELQRFPDKLSAALMQQFRRPSFFSKVSASVPGLNYLGKAFTVDKTLAFNIETNEVPAVQCKADWRVDLRAWDDYLERDGRTKDDPFDRTLVSLRGYAISIAGLNDDGSEEIELSAEFKAQISTT